MLKVWFWIIRKLQVYCVCQGLENLMIAIAEMHKESSGRFWMLVWSKTTVLS